MTLRDRESYDRAFAIVRSTINAWDPEGLVSGGAPLDEWDSEVAKIVAQIPRMRNEQDAVHAISRIFSGALEPGPYRAENCESVGRSLYKALADANLLG